MRLMRAGAIETAVLGSRAAVAIAPGTIVDVDQVVGETAGTPLTLADALGPALLAHFAPLEPAVPTRPRRRASTTAERAARTDVDSGGMTASAR